MDSQLSDRITACTGAKKPSLVLKNAQIVNVFTSELENADIAIEDGYIVGLGSYDGEREIDLSGHIVCPGLIDGHIHLESSMVTPNEFEKAVMPHGTVAVVTDPHEIANVAGKEGIRFMLDQTENLLLDVYYMLPSCVPASGLDESGAALGAEDLTEFYQNDRVLGLAEVMDSYGVVRTDLGVLSKIEDALSKDRLVDGHAPGLSGKALNAYITAGVRSEHECSDFGEAIEKLRRGQWIMIREGTAAHNLEALLPLFGEKYFRRCMLVTDDKHPGNLLRLGHIDSIIRKAIGLGADPLHAVIMGSCHPARYFRLKNRGAVAPGYKADLTIVSDLTRFEVKQVYKDGNLVAENGQLLTKTIPVTLRNRPYRVYQSFHMKEVVKEDLQFHSTGAYERVLCLTPYDLTTCEKIVPWVEKTGYAKGVDVDQDIIKLAVFERHRNTGHIGLGFLGGYGLKIGAVATSIAHDSHNLIIAGTNDEDMVLAANTVRKNGGGLAIAADGDLLGALELPVAGLMSEMTVEEVDKKLVWLKTVARRLGIPNEIDPFMTLAFTSLPVIPKLRLNTYGLIHTSRQEVLEVLLPAFVEEKL